MDHETIVINEAGEKLKYVVQVFESRNSLSYRISLFICPSGKRKYVAAYDTDDYIFRRLSMEERAANVKQKVISIGGVDNYNKALKSAWLSLEPEYEQA